MGGRERQGMAGTQDDATQPATHIMVINDTPEILDLFTELLESEGYRVTTDRFTIELAQMLQRVRDLQPDLMVLDFIIGREGQGWQFLQLLKMDRQTRTIPVVVCTAAVTIVRDLQPHLDDMGVRVVLKPFDIDVVLSTVALHLEKAADSTSPDSGRAED
jgi:CheY-like chemotaxis protein